MIDTLVDSFDIWGTAQTQKSLGKKAGIDNISLHGINRLRELIFELAVRGKLVEQDSNDETAFELLQKIVAEKQKLIDKGEIKNHKQFPEIIETEKLFELPKGWVWGRLGNFSYVFSGASFKSEDFKQIGSVRAIKITNAGVGEFIETEDFLPVGFLEEYQNFIVKENDLILALTRPYISTGLKISKCPNSYNNSLLNQRVAAIRTYIDTNFLFIYLSSNIVLNIYKERFGKSGLQPNLKMSDVTDMLVPIAPLAEQHRIVAKVNDLMALCDKLEQQKMGQIETHLLLVKVLLKTLTDAKDAESLKAAWNHLESHFDILFTTEESVNLLKQTILQLAVMGKLVPQYKNDEPTSELLKKIEAEKLKLIKEGKLKKQKPLPEITEEEKPFELPEGWEWSRLGTIGIGSTGKTPSTRNPIFFKGDIPFIGPGQITNSGDIVDSEKTLSKAGCEQSTIAEYGDIVMVCIGGSIGKSAIVKSKIAFNQQINCTKPILSNSSYMSLALNSSYFQNAVLEKATGSATPIINRSKWEEILVPLCSINEQNRIVTKVDELLTLCDRLKERIVASQEIKVKLADAVVERAVNESSGKSYEIKDSLNMVAEKEIRKY
ncbi:restriction endonuclease subunit S [Saccharicrinis sp. FJH54]|uniref:restriction endonuclease subunit S n=1 Tax=Saccharicrinis sp. FJH54 TaxID=3344665 RepID=UPI0035D3F042